jgi:hypothetical protein
MLPSRSPWRTSAAAAGLALSAAAHAGCGDDCGPGGAPSTGLVLAGDTATLTYGTLSGLIGNDCPDPAAPAGVISLSIEGFQDGGTGRITFCVPRPDLLMQGARTLGTATSTSDVRIIDANGMAAGCTFAIDSAQQPSGSAEASGVCDNGDSPDGFALSLDGTVTLKRTCGPTMDSIAATLRGRVAVTRRQQ